MLDVWGCRPGKQGDNWSCCARGAGAATGGWEWVIRRSPDQVREAD